jgi:hypothetical protein
MNVITIHCWLKWTAEGEKGQAQFDIPYFMYKPGGGKLIWEDQGKHKDDAAVISEFSRAFGQIVRAGDLTIPVYAIETEAVYGLQDAHAYGKTVDFAMGLLQDGKALRVAMRLIDAKVVEILPRSILSGGGKDKHGFIAHLKSPPPKDLKTLEARG